MLIDTFVNAIFLYDDKMVLTFNFREGEETIRLDQLEEAMENREIGSDMKWPGEPKGAVSQRDSPFCVQKEPGSVKRPANAVKCSCETNTETANRL